VQAKSVIIATGAHYNRLPLDRLAEFEGVGVYYAATEAEAQACGGGPVAIVGGGNSVGQAALFLSRSCSQVHVIIRANTLDASMSRYLVDRIEREPRITVSPHTQVTELIGTDHLESVRIRGAGQAAESDLAVRALFVFIGAKPRTEWLAGQLAQDSHGFLLTGSDIPQPNSTTRAARRCSGDQQAGDLRRRRRPQRVSQARRGRHRGRLHGGTARIRPPPVHRHRVGNRTGQWRGLRASRAGAAIPPGMLVQRGAGCGCGSQEPSALTTASVKAWVLPAAGGDRLAGSRGRALPENLSR
jgi:Pyridine nucleotide-disulphide oxidoreductase